MIQSRHQETESDYVDDDTIYIGPRIGTAIEYYNDI